MLAYIRFASAILSSAWMPRTCLMLLGVVVIAGLLDFTQIAAITMLTFGMVMLMLTAMLMSVLLMLGPDGELPG